MKTRLLVLPALLPLIATAAPPTPVAPAPAPYGALPSPRQVKHAEIEQYAFIHFTLNTYTDKEWGFGDENPKLFDPKQFDADRIVGAVKSAGLRGVIITCKHHDGFCLWPTKSTEHNITKSPFRNGKGDVVREIEQAARRAGLKFGVYVSPWDRNSEHYGTPKYVTDVFRTQMRELLSSYGDIFEIWFDGANGGDGYYGGKRGKRGIDRATYYDWKNTWQIVRDLQPGASIFTDLGPELRWIGNEEGFAKDPCWATYTPVGRDGKEESAVPGSTRYQDGEHGTRNGKYWIQGEVDVSTRPGWFWHAHENTKVKPPKRLFKIYMESVGRGASLILNVPPDRRGLVHENDAASLKALGDTLEKTYAKNFAVGAIFSASNTRAGDAGWGPERLVDDDRWSAWATDDAVTTPSVEITLPKAETINHIRLREDIRLGQRVEGVSVDARIDGAWKEVAKAESIGTCRLWDFPAVTTDRIRLRVTKSPVCPALSDFGLYFRPDLPDIDFSATAKKRAGKNWTVSGPGDAKRVADGDPKTLWTADANQRLPQSLTIDLGRTVAKISGITVTPRRDRVVSGIVDRYRTESSADGKNWIVSAEGEFSNIRANPIEQTILFSTPASSARFVRFTAERTLDDGTATIAEIDVIE